MKIFYLEFGVKNMHVVANFGEFQRRDPSAKRQNKVFSIAAKANFHFEQVQQENDSQIGVNILQHRESCWYII